MMYRYLLIIFLVMECKIPCKAQARYANADINHLKFTVSVDTLWTNLFKRTSGWFGGDGIYSVPLKRKGIFKKEKTLFIFSDSMLGTLKNGIMQPGSVMVHNTIAYLNGTKPKERNLTFLWDKDETGRPLPAFVPQTPNTKSDEYFWLGAGFSGTLANNPIYLFGYRVKNTNDKPFGFAEVGNVLIKIPSSDVFPFKHQKQRDTPLFLEHKNETGSFGAGVYLHSNPKVNEDTVFIYGVKGKNKEVLVAKVASSEFEDFTKWSYWGGSSWTSNMVQAAAIADKASNELSVSRLSDGRYAMVFQISGISNKIGLRLALRPEGPWGQIIEIYDCSNELIKKNFYAYNAKAHPSLSRKNELLISFNVNSFEFFSDLTTNPQLYRPRFIKLKLR